MKGWIIIIMGIIMLIVSFVKAILSKETDIIGLASCIFVPKMIQYGWDLLHKTEEEVIL